MSSSEINPEVKISGVICQPLMLYNDQRGWLAEIFRQDELAPEHFPVMAYISVTAPGMARGPHAHGDQTDLCCFSGPGKFREVLWDNRKDRPPTGLERPGGTGRVPVLACQYR